MRKEDSYRKARDRRPEIWPRSDRYRNYQQQSPKFPVSGSTHTETKIRPSTKADTTVDHRIRQVHADGF